MCKQIENVIEHATIKQLLKQSLYSKEDLTSILEYYLENLPIYNDIAHNFSSEIREFNGVHSIKYRIKSLFSLCEKILRKESESQIPLNADSLNNEITDIIGIRAIYIYPTDYKLIHDNIYKNYSKLFCENVCINIRDGDDESMFDSIPKKRRTINKGLYRSIHYILNYLIGNNNYKLEVQIRTIFEEGWSEINHQYYKDNNTNETTQWALSILSRQVGICNEMSFLIKLVNSLPLSEISKGSIKKDDNKTVDFSTVMTNFLYANR